MFGVTLLHTDTRAKFVDTGPARSVTALRKYVDRGTNFMIIMYAALQASVLLYRGYPRACGCVFLAQGMVVRLSSTVGATGSRALFPTVGQVSV